MSTSVVDPGELSKTAALANLITAGLRFLQACRLLDELPNPKPTDKDAEALGPIEEGETIL